MRNWENAGKVPNTPEALAYQAAAAQYESDRALVQYSRPSTKQYELSYIKYKYFNEIFKTLSEKQWYIKDIKLFSGKQKAGGNKNIRGFC